MTLNEAKVAFNKLIGGRFWPNVEEKEIIEGSIMSKQKPTLLA